MTSLFLLFLGLALCQQQAAPSTTPQPQTTPKLEQPQVPQNQGQQGQLGQQGQMGQQGQQGQQGQLGQQGSLNPDLQNLPFDAEINQFLQMIDQVRQGLLRDKAVVETALDDLDAQEVSIWDTLRGGRGRGRNDRDEDEDEDSFGGLGRSRRSRRHRRHRRSYF